MTLEQWKAGIVARHDEAVARGAHDDQCEWRPAGFYLCHCSKRRRERDGFTEPPSDELYFPPPLCPRCDKDLDHDGDSWQCYSCSLMWSTNGSSAEFTDIYSDDLTADVAEWEAKHAARTPA